jgi:hypothetical protein
LASVGIASAALPSMDAYCGATRTECSPFYRIADQAEINRLFDGKHGRSFKNGGGEHCPAIRFTAQTDFSQSRMKKSAPMARSGKSVLLILNG